MKQSAAQIGVGIGLALAALAVAGTSVWLLGPRSSPLPLPPPPPRPAPRPSGVDFGEDEGDVLVGDPGSGSAQREIEALARMLLSEDPRRRVQIVIGWTAVMAASRWGLSVFRLLTGKSGKYGPQKHLGEVRYAATTRAATPAALRLAEQLLSGEVQPSQQIRDHGPGAWVEEGVLGYTPLRILQRQLHQTGPKKGLPDFGGIWGRLEGTKWYLYDAKSPILTTPGTEEEAAAVLAAVPEIPAEDPIRVA